MPLDDAGLNTWPLPLTVLYLALIAFWDECCRIAIQFEDVFYTENLAKESPLVSYPAPARLIFIVPRHYPAPPLRQ